jgi:cyclopropane fatty-acyl-phospholipid synthase-like methyltransferase
MYKKNLKFWPRFYTNLSFNALIKSYPNYQPIFRRGEIKPGSDRECFDRWELIKKEIIESRAKTFLDLGSSEGFYVLQAAKECGCLSLGVDADIRKVAMANYQLILEKINSAGFLFGVINQDFLERLPNFDIVIFMSVLHHIMYSEGEEYCRIILKKIMPKINKIMIFEMGQSDEIKNKWAEKLPNMGNDPHKWIANFLASCGFSKITKIGESNSYQKDKKRAIFKIEP